MLSLIGQKKEQTQKFLENGNRIPVTRVFIGENKVTAVKTMDKDKYSSVQLGFGMKKKANKAILGHAKGAGLTTAPSFLKEVRILDESDQIPEKGAVIKASDVFVPGDIVDVTGTSKGKGFAGGVKRYHFKGGPKTHGQSDRLRAPGSIGQGTTPGRVYKGKRMAGRMGDETVTVKNLKIVDVTDDEVLIKGLVPGSLQSMLVIKKVGEAKKFTALYHEKTNEEVTSSDDVVQSEATEVQAELAPIAEVPAEAGLDTEAAKAEDETSAESDKDKEVKEGEENANS